MTTDVWKQYDGHAVTHSMGHYLMAVRDLLKARGYARVTDVASFLEVSRSSASTFLHSLRKKGFLDEDENHFLRLSPRGEEISLQIVRNQLILESFFRNILGVEEEQALVDACKMEHLLSPETSYRLLALIQILQTDPELRAKAIEGVARQACPQTDDCPICADSPSCLMERTVESLKKNPL